MDKSELEATIIELKDLNSFHDAILRDHEIKICLNNQSTGSSSEQVECIEKRLRISHSSKDKKSTTRCTCVEQGGTILIRSYVEVNDSHNFISGSWFADWSADSFTEKTAKLKGSVYFHVKYCEGEANVQTRSTRGYKAYEVSTQEEKVNALVHLWEKEKMSYEDQLAQVICDAINAREQEAYHDLQVMFQEFDISLKKVRRILPITKTRFKWDGAAQKQVKLLNERK